MQHYPCVCISGGNMYSHGWRNLFQSGRRHKCTSKNIERFCVLNW